MPTLGQPIPNDTTQVAEWAGHSVHVLIKVYAKCIDGQEEAAQCRIEAALNTAAAQRHGRRGPARGLIRRVKIRRISGLTL